MGGGERGAPSKKWKVWEYHGMERRRNRSVKEKKPVGPRDVVRRLFSDILSGASPEATSRVVASNVVIHGAYPEDITGLASFKKLLATFAEAFPRVKLSTDSVVEMGDIVVCRWSATGKIANAWPLPVVDLEIPGAVWTFRVRNARIVEIWSMDISFDPSDYEEDDDDGPVGGAPPGPRWVPPEPTPTRRPPAKPDDRAP